MSHFFQWTFHFYTWFSKHSFPCSLLVHFNHFRFHIWVLQNFWIWKQFIEFLFPFLFNILKHFLVFFNLFLHYFVTLHLCFKVVPLWIKWSQIIIHKHSRFAVNGLEVLVLILLKFITIFFVNTRSLPTFDSVSYLPVRALISPKAESSNFIL